MLGRLVDRLICMTCRPRLAGILSVDDELRLCPSPDGADDLAEAYLVQRRTPGGWEAVGDVILSPDYLTLVIAPRARRQGIARRVLLRLVDRARVLGWSELRVRELATDDEASHRLFTGLGFVPIADGPSAFVLRLAPLGGRPRR